MQLSIFPDIALGRGDARLEALRGTARGAPGAPGTPGPVAERQRLRKAAGEFEAIMLELMVKAMRKNVPESPIFGRDNGREIFSEMLDSEYVRLMVNRGGIGLTDLMVQQLGTRP